MVGTATDSLVLIDLDFEPALPCEHSEHGDAGIPAAWVEDGQCPRCAVRLKVLLCTPCKDYAGECATIRHDTGCGAVTLTEKWNLTYTPIEEVR